MVNDPINILYITSNGRSGSTILEMLLHSNPNFWTLGEFHVLPWEIKTNSKPCGCHVPVDQCAFWGPLIRDHRQLLLAGSISRFRASYNTDSLIRMGELRSVFSGNLGVSKRSRAGKVRTYARDNQTFLEAVANRARSDFRPQVRWLVDSSKSPYRLMWLAASRSFNLRVIHLIKDPRAFAYSILKNRKQPRWGRLLRATRAATRWQVENRLIKTICDKYVDSSDSRVVRYEDLASCPDETVDGILRWLGLAADSKTTERFRDEENHGISGNPSRFGAREIQLDEKWRTGISAVETGIVKSLTGQLATDFGYHF